MNETEWLVSTDPQRMLEYLRTGGPEGPIFEHRPPLSERRLRLFACACARLPNHLPLHGEFQKAIECAEAAADRGESPDFNGEWIVTERDAAFAARMTCGDLVEFHPEQVPLGASILRDIFGNPFRDLKFDYCLKQDEGHKGECPTIRSQVCTPTVLAIAQAIYAERAFDRMPILADALEEAGCTEASVLEHLRKQPLNLIATTGQVDREVGNNLERCKAIRKKWGVGGVAWGGTDVAILKEAEWRVAESECPHVRGCWVLDLILGRA